jgi:hypothetical protein
MIHVAIIIAVVSLLLPPALFAVAFLIALVDYVLALLFSHPAPPLVDDSLDPA